MTITITIPPEDLANIRFTFSPLLEIATSYRALRDPKQHSLYWRWIEEAQQALYDVELPYMDATIPPKHYMADFLTPPPLTTQTNLDDEIERIREISDAFICQNIKMLIRGYGETDARNYFLTDTRRALENLIVELRFYWDRTLAHHWARMVATLEGDILYRAHQLANGGTDALLQSLNPYLRYEDGKLIIEKPDDYYPAGTPVKHDKNYILNGDGNGIQISPAIFAGDHVWHQVIEGWQPMIIYNARGTGLWYNGADIEPARALMIAIGESRARILSSLRQPASTSELADQLGVTPAAISQQIDRLHQAGLVISSRNGNRVYHRLSQRGIEMIRLFS